MAISTTWRAEQLDDGRWVVVNDNWEGDYIGDWTREQAELGATMLEHGGINVEGLTIYDTEIEVSDQVRYVRCEEGDHQAMAAQVNGNACIKHAN